MASQTPRDEDDDDGGRAAEREEEPTTTTTTAAFAQHAAADSALAETANGVPPPTGARRGTTYVGRFVVFIVFPLATGLAGLYVAYLETIREPERRVRLERDFALPFLLALAMVAVIGFQTNNFTADKFQPLVQWPKVKRVKKYVHKKKKKKALKEE
jgi:hypothetical protein